MFGSVLNRLPGDEVPGFNVVDYDYPADFSQRWFVPTVRRLVSRIKSILSNSRSRPLERSTSGQDLVRKMQQIISILNIATEHDIWPRMDLIVTMRTQLKQGRHDKLESQDAAAWNDFHSTSRCLYNHPFAGVLSTLTHAAGTPEVTGRKGAGGEYRCRSRRGGGAVMEKDSEVGGSYSRRIRQLVLWAR